MSLHQSVYVIWFHHDQLRFMKHNAPVFVNVNPSVSMDKQSMLCLTKGTMVFWIPKCSNKTESVADVVDVVVNQP